MTEESSIRMFEATLKRAIARDDEKHVRAVAEMLLDLAAHGEPWAIKELADRLDGRATQTVYLDEQALSAGQIDARIAVLVSAIEKAKA